VFRLRAQAHCAALGVSTPPIAIMDARTRWGSCTPAAKGRPASIRLSWRLALAPAEVSDYVVAHECAHLLEANHGPRFWAHVHRLVGDHRPHRAWLRAHGASLHAFGR
jgi:predicted metal-dependent hydrolase